jgi:arylsulfatase A
LTRSLPRSILVLAFYWPTTNDRVPQVYVHDHRVPNLDPADPLWMGNRKPSPDHPTGLTHRETLKMDWSHGHNSTIHNGIRRIGFYTGGHAARFRDEDLAHKCGTRTPFITRWKGRIPAGVSDQIVCTVDLAASLAALTGQTLPTDGCLDSFNVLDALLGADGAAGRDHLVQQNNGNNGTYALRVGPWKLHRYDRKTARNVKVEAQLANTSVPRFQLFHLDEDPAERANVIEQHPEVAVRLKEQLATIIQQGRSRP